MYLSLECCETLSLKRPCSGCKVRQFWRKFLWWGGGILKIELLLFSITFFKFRLLQITLYSIYVLYTLFNVTVVWWRKKLVYRTTTPPLKRQCSGWRTYGSFGANSKNSCLGKGGRMCKGWSTFLFQFLFLIIYFYKPTPYLCTLHIIWWSFMT